MFSSKLSFECTNKYLYGMYIQDILMYTSSLALRVIRKSKGF